MLILAGLKLIYMFSHERSIWGGGDIILKTSTFSGKEQCYNRKEGEIFK